MNFKRVTILTLSRDNAETIGVGWHCFEFWDVFVIATEKKIFMQQEAFSFVRAKKKKLPDFCILVRIDSMAKQLKLIKNQNSS